MQYIENSTLGMSIRKASSPVADSYLLKIAGLNEPILLLREVKLPNNSLSITLLEASTKWPASNSLSFHFSIAENQGSVPQAHK